LRLKSCLDLSFSPANTQVVSYRMAKKRKQAIVVFNGCFCPVHAGHVKALLDTRRKVEASGKFQVVAGYFAVAPDGFVSTKVDGKLEPWMTAHARVEMCKAVAEDEDWSISAAEFAGWKQCGKAMVNRFHAAETEIISVRGEAKQGGVNKKGTGETAELSSTAIRAALARLGYTPQAVDDLVSHRLLGRAVGECLKQKLGHMAQQVDCICCDGSGELLGSECPLCDGLARFPAWVGGPPAVAEPGRQSGHAPFCTNKSKEASKQSEKDEKKKGRKARR